MQTASLHGERYFITFTDEMSGRVSVCLLHSKDGALAAFQTYQARAHLQKITLRQIPRSCVLMQAMLNLLPLHPVRPELRPLRSVCPELRPVRPVRPALPGNACSNSMRPEFPRNAGSHPMPPVSRCEHLYVRMGGCLIAAS